MAKCSMSFEDITDINVKISVDTSLISERLDLVRWIFREQVCICDV